MSRIRFFLKKNNQVSLAKLLLTTALIVALVVFAAAATQYYVFWPWGRLGFLAAGAGVAGAFLLYGLVIAPLLHLRPEPPGRAQLLSTIDPVTHALNTRGVTISVLEAMAQAQRYDTPLSLAVLQVTHKDGAVPEPTLQLVAQTITEVLRLPDRVGRYGETEFLVVMPQTRLPDAERVAARIREAVGQARTTPEAVPPEIDVGVVEFTKDQDLEKLLTQARAALRPDKPRARSARKSARKA